MKRRSHTRCLLKWSCAVATGLFLAAWAFSANFSFDISSQYSFQIEDHNLRLLLWPTPRASGQPDCYTIPIWIPLIAATVLTGCLWLLDRRERMPDGYCRQCGYNLIGNISGRCPECGVDVEREGEEA